MIEKSKFRDLTISKKSSASPKKVAKPRRGSRFERHRVARLMAIQAVYEANHNSLSYQQTTKSFLEFRFKNHEHPINPDRELFLFIMKNIEERIDTVQETLKNVIVGTWSVDSIDSVLKSILMVGITELLSPYQNATKGLIISEYVEIAKGFFNSNEPAYVNKALDTISKIL